MTTVDYDDGERRRQQRRRRQGKVVAQAQDKYRVSMAKGDDLASSPILVVLYIILWHYLLTTSDAETSR